MPKRKYVLFDLDKAQTRLEEYLTTVVAKREQEKQKHNQLLKFIKEAQTKGLTVKEIAHLIGEGVSRQNVYRWLKEVQEKEPDAEDS